MFVSVYYFFVNQYTLPYQNESIRYSHDYMYTVNPCNSMEFSINMEEFTIDCEEMRSIGIQVSHN